MLSWLKFEYSKNKSDDATSISFPVKDSQLSAMQQKNAHNERSVAEIEDEDAILALVK